MYTFTSLKKIKTIYKCICVQELWKESDENQLQRTFPSYNSKLFDMRILN